MDGDLRLYPLWQTLTGDMLIRPFYPQAPLPHYISLDQLSAYIAGAAAAYPTQAILVPTAGQTLDVPQVAKTILNPAGPLAACTLRLPDAADKRTLRIATRQRIDSLMITALGGRSVDWAVGELPANGMLDLTLVQSLNAWVRA